MNYLILFASILLTACGNGSGNNKESTESITDINNEISVIENPITSIWYGDSRCAANPYLENKHCVPGMAMSRMEPIDFSYDRIIIHLGVNSMTWLDVKIWAFYLEELIRPAPYNVWCILPSWVNPTVSVQTISDYRDAMVSICVNTVDPQIQAFQDDGIHYTDFNYRQVSDIYNNIMAL